MHTNTKHSPRASDELDVEFERDDLALGDLFGGYSVEELEFEEALVLMEGGSVVFRTRHERDE